VYDIPPLLGRTQAAFKHHHDGPCLKVIWAYPTFYPLSVIKELGFEFFGLLLAINPKPRKIKLP